MRNLLVKLCLFNLLLICRINVSAQSDSLVIDSLRKVLQTQKEDTSRVRTLEYLSGEYIWKKPDSAIIFGQQGLALASRIHDFEGEAAMKHAIGMALWLLGDYLQADKTLQEELKYAESVHDTDWMINIYAAICSNKRDHEDYREALNYSFRAYSLCKGCDLFKMIIGSIYAEMNMSDSAFYYLKQAQPSGYVLWLLGRTYENTGNDKLAYQYYLQSILDTNGMVKDLSEAYSSLARLFKKTNKIDSCIYYSKKAYSTASEVNYRKGMWETALLLSVIYENINPHEALHYYKLATAAKDSLFNLQKTTQFLNSQFNEQLQQQELQQKLAQFELVYKNRLNIYFLLAGLVILIIVAGGLWRRNVYKQKSYSVLQKQKLEIDVQKAKVEQALDELKSTQQQLIQSEKMASLGELTAGIAHEIQNPLNFVNNFSEVNKELIEEVKSQKSKLKNEELDELLNDIAENEEKINHHGKRADAIVKNMLQHSRQIKGVKDPTDINALCDEYLRLSFHGMRAKDKSFNADFKTDFDNTIGKINIVPQDIGRVLLNLFNNAFYAINEKQKLTANGYQPIAEVKTRRINDKVEITVTDNGSGIPQNIIDKIFQPFFTTKPTGEGTGLGLSLSYDIIKAHGGEIKVESKQEEGSTFTIKIPAV